MPTTAMWPEGGWAVTVRLDGLIVPPPVTRVAALKLLTWYGRMALVAAQAVPVAEHAVTEPANATVKLPDPPLATA